MAKPIEDIAQVTPAWLTRRLLENHHLNSSDSVTHVEIVSHSRNRSNLSAHLRVGYSSTVSELPTCLFVKTGDSGMCVDCEVTFHNDILSYMGESPAVPHYDAAWSKPHRNGHLVFQDASRTHYHGKFGIHPGLQSEAELIIDAFAPFHAFWWDHPELGNAVGSFPDEDFVLWYQGVASYEKALGRFIDLAGDRLSRRRRTLCERVLGAFPFKDLRGRSRLAPGNRLTLIHADARYDNILLPRDAAKQEVYIIDWAFWEVRMGTDDIAHLAIYGFGDPKAGLTRSLVKRYHGGLLKHGVTDYDWDDCWHDYRISTLRHLFIPISSAANGSDFNYCWRNLERSFRSVRDLGCRELLN